jgi:hypothetical protein
MLCARFSPQLMVRFAAPAARLAVKDLDATRRELERSAVDFKVIDGVLLIAASAAHGLALEFVEQGAI